MSKRLIAGHVLLVSGLLFLDSLAPPQYLQNKIFISVEVLIASSVVLHALLGYWTKLKFTNTALIFSTLITTSLCLASTVMYYLENSFYANYVFSQTHLHPDSFRFLALYWWFITFTTLLLHLKKIGKVIVLCIPFLILLLLLLLEASFLNTFITIGTEDHIIEWVSSIVFIGAAIISMMSAIKHHQNFLLLSIFSLLSIGFLLVAGEEISWGQRILALESNEFFQEVNVQGEITLHNLKPIQDKLGYIYMVAGLTTGLAFLVKRKVTHPWLKNILPDLHLSTYFLPLAMYGAIRVFIGPLQYKTWEETLELLVALGVLIHLYSFYKSSQLSLNKNK
jgi:hypothetical protein